MKDLTNELKSSANRISKRNHKFAERHYLESNIYTFDQDSTKVLEEYPANIFANAMKEPNTLVRLLSITENNYLYVYWGYYDTKNKTITSNYPRTTSDIHFYLKK